MLWQLCWLETLQIYSSGCVCACVFHRASRIRLLLEALPLLTGPSLFCLSTIISEFFVGLLLPHLASSQQSRQSGSVQNVVRTCLSSAENLPDGFLSQSRSWSPYRDPPGIEGPPTPRLWPHLSLFIFSSYTSESWLCSSSWNAFHPRYPKAFRSLPPFLQIFAQIPLFPRRPSHLISYWGSLPLFSASCVSITLLTC